MKVLILGATGGTARLIARDAVAKGHSMVALVRASDLAGADLIEGDGRDESALIRALAYRSGSWQPAWGGQRPVRFQPSEWTGRRQRALFERQKQFRDRLIHPRGGVVAADFAGDVQGTRTGASISAKRTATTGLSWMMIISATTRPGIQNRR